VLNIFTVTYLGQLSACHETSFGVSFERGYENEKKSGSHFESGKAFDGEVKKVKSTRLTHFFITA